MNQRSEGFYFAMIGAVCWGTSGTFNKLLIDMGLAPNEVAIIGPAFLMCFFFVILLITNRGGFKVPQNMISTLIVYGLFSAIFNLAFVNSLNYFPVGIVSTLQFCSVFLLIVISYFLFHDPITARKIVASVFAVMGIGMVLNVFQNATNWSGVGFLWMFAACFSWASMYACEKRMLNHNVSGSTIIMFSGLFTVLVLSMISPPWNLIQDIITVGQATSGAAYIIIVCMGVVSQVGCYWFYVNSLKKTEPAYTQMAFVMDPVTACILGYVVFNQQLLPIQIAGIGLILLLVIWIQMSEMKPRLLRNTLKKSERE